MEETTIVIMLKDEETGFLDQELGSYSVPERAELIWSIYVKSNESLRIGNTKRFLIITIQNL